MRILPNRNLFEKLVQFIIMIVTMLLSCLVVSAFLSHWSLLDGAPRNSLQMFMDEEAHRPFAYRILGPTVVRYLDNFIPQSAQDFLANNVAPKFRSHYVEPLITIYESRLPGIKARADTSWQNNQYRRFYVLMVVVMFASFTCAMFVLRKCAELLGANKTTSFGLMVLYAAMTPTMFLNGGYFYDFIEQLGVCLLILWVLRNLWLPALMILILMQSNKETALLMVFFLAPIAWHDMHWEIAVKGAVALGLCLMMYLAIRIQFSSLPGSPSEWHLPDNLIFWTEPKSWISTEDFYSAGFRLPRFTYLIFAIMTLLMGWYRGFSPLLLSTTLAFSSLLMLLVSMGFQDEFRNLSLSLPLLVLMWARAISSVSKERPREFEKCTSAGDA